MCYAIRNCRGVCRLLSSSCTGIWREYPISIRLLFFLALIIEISFQNPVVDTPEWSFVTSSHGSSDASTTFWVYNLGKPSQIRSYLVNCELSATMFTRGKGDRVLVMCALTGCIHPLDHHQGSSRLSDGHGSGDHLCTCTRMPYFHHGQDNSVSFHDLVRLAV